MKMIRAIIRPEKTNDVLKELSDAGFPSVTKIDVAGRGKQRGVKVGNVHYDELPKSLFMMVVEDEYAEDLTRILIRVAKTGEDGSYGDGKIFVNEVEAAYTVSSGEEVL